MDRNQRDMIHSYVDSRLLVLCKRGLSFRKEQTLCEDLTVGSEGLGIGWVVD